MTKEQQKLVVAISLLPVLADFLEDQTEFRTAAKFKMNNLVNQIRSFDKFFMDTAGKTEVTQQNDLQLWFRQLIETKINK